MAFWKLFGAQDPKDAHIADLKEQIKEARLEKQRKDRQIEELQSQIRMVMEERFFRPVLGPSAPQEPKDFSHLNDQPDFNDEEAMKELSDLTAEQAKTH